jgi:hypothetical protein
MPGWRCLRCGTSNDDVVVSCSRCGASRGAVVLPGPATADDGAPIPGSTTEKSTSESLPEAGNRYEWQPRAPSPPGEPGDAVASAPRPLWRRIPVGLVVFAGLIAVGALSSFFFSASRSDTGEISRSGDIDVNDLRVGDCFDFKDPEAEEFDQVAARPCSQEHGYELFFVGPMPAETYPSDDAFDSYVTDACEPAFATYVGRSYQSSRLGLTWVGPTEDAWNSGDHAVQCLLNDPQRPRMTTSLKGSNL